MDHSCTATANFPSFLSFAEMPGSLGDRAQNGYTRPAVRPGNTLTGELTLPALMALARDTAMPRRCYGYHPVCSGAGVQCAPNLVKLRVRGMRTPEAGRGGNPRSVARTCPPFEFGPRFAGSTVSARGTIFRASAKGSKRRHVRASDIRRGG